jgi:hypothetical protein
MIEGGAAVAFAVASARNKWDRNFDQCAPSASNDFSPLKRYIGSRLIGNRLSIQWIEA